MELIGAIIGVGVVIGVGLWMWKDKNSDKAVEVVQEARETVQDVVKEAVAKAKKAKAKK